MFLWCETWTSSSRTSWPCCRFWSSCRRKYDWCRYINMYFIIVYSAAWPPALQLKHLGNRFFGCIMCFQLHQLMSNSGTVVNVECWLGKVLSFNPFKKKKYKHVMRCLIEEESLMWNLMHLRAVSYTFQWECSILHFLLGSSSWGSVIWWAVALSWCTVCCISLKVDCQSFVWHIVAGLMAAVEIK